MAKIMKFNILEAVEILAILCCDQDPVFYKGEEYDVSYLETIRPCLESASKIKIEFYGHIKYKKRLQLIKGTLQTLVEFRLQGN